jgi:hypothetical protein
VSLLPRANPAIVHFAGKTLTGSPTIDLCSCPATPLGVWPQITWPALTLSAANPILIWTVVDAVLVVEFLEGLLHFGRQISGMVTGKLRNRLPAIGFQPRHNRNEAIAQRNRSVRLDILACFSITSRMRKQYAELDRVETSTKARQEQPLSFRLVGGTLGSFRDQTVHTSQGRAVLIFAERLCQSLDIIRRLEQRLRLAPQRHGFADLQNLLQFGRR